MISVISVMHVDMKELFKPSSIRLETKNKNVYLKPYDNVCFIRMSNANVNSLKKTDNELNKLSTDILSSYLL